MHMLLLTNGEDRRRSSISSIDAIRAESERLPRMRSREAQTDFCTTCAHCDFALICILP